MEQFDEYALHLLLFPVTPVKNLLTKLSKIQI